MKNDEIPTTAISGSCEVPRSLALPRPKESLRLGNRASVMFASGSSGTMIFDNIDAHLAGATEKQ